MARHPRSLLFFAPSLLLALVSLAACGGGETPPPDVPAPRECPATCGEGEAGQALVDALTERATFAGGCYDEIVKDGRASGRLLVNVVITEDGSVCRAALAEDTTGNADLGRCVLSRVTSGRYPGTSAGCVVINMPISFRPSAAKAAACQALVESINVGVSKVPALRPGEEAAASLRAFAEGMARVGTDVGALQLPADLVTLRDEYGIMTQTIADAAKELADATDAKDEARITVARVRLEAAAKAEDPLVKRIDRACQAPP
jgi:predicted small lipoprotein YifL